LLWLAVTCLRSERDAEQTECPALHLGRRGQYDVDAIYGTPEVNRDKVAALAPQMQPGAHLAWLDQAQPMYRKDLLRLEAAIGIVRSTMHRYRCLLIWRRVLE
jgi:hypothetical protein